jgi:hypothetical protein
MTFNYKARAADASRTGNTKERNDTQIKYQTNRIWM